MFTILVYLKVLTYKMYPGKYEYFSRYFIQDGNLTLFSTILGLQFWLTDKHFKDGKVGDKEAQ